MKFTNGNLPKSRKKSINSVNVLNYDSNFKFNQKKLILLIKSVLKKLRFKGKEFTLVFVTDREIKRLNKRHLNHNWVTDVLAFPSQGKVLGEVIISPKQAKQYAKKMHLLFREELTRYICHGILHLKGFDDHSKKKRQIMETKENQLIAEVIQYTKEFRYGH